MGDSYNRLPASGVQTVVLAFELSNYTDKTTLDAIQKAVKNPSVQKAITDAMQTRAKTQLQALKASAPTVSPKAGAGGGAGTSSSSSSLPLGAGSASSVQDAIKQLQLNPDFSLLMDDLKKLQTQFEKSVIGVWVDQNKKTLIIIASGLIVVGATAMYLTKTGDTPADWATQLAKGKYPLFTLGKIEFGVGDPQFKPSTSTVGGTATFDVKNLKFIKEAELDVTVAHSTAGMQNAGVAGKVTVALPHAVSVTTQGSIDPIAQLKKIHLGIDYDQDGIKVGVFGEVSQTKGVTTNKAGLSAGYKYGSMEFGLKGDISKSPNSAPAVTGLGTFTYRFK